MQVFATVVAGDDYGSSTEGGAAMSGPGETRPAGEGVNDEEMAREVAGQTSSDLKAATSSSGRPRVPRATPRPPRPSRRSCRAERAR
jgi:hypothetical protein